MISYGCIPEYGGFPISNRSDDVIQQFLYRGSLCEDDIVPTAQFFISQKTCPLVNVYNYIITGLCPLHELSAVANSPTSHSYSHTCIHYS